MTPDAAALTAASRSALRYGFSALLLFLVGGLSLEFLHLIKAPWYLDHHLRRELWVLAHAHGALLAVLVLLWAALLPRLPAAVDAGCWLRWGAALVPAGFFVGGLGNTESDPSPGILLTPIGAALVLWALALTAKAAWRGDTASPPPSAGAAAPAAPAAEAQTRKPARTGRR